MQAIKVWLTTHWFTSLLIAITLLAAVIRLYNLGIVPSGLTWDEAAIGYNGFAVSHTLRDEWLKFLPISFKSFGDYKAPLAIYLNGFFTLLLGLNPTAVRLPFAFAGILSVLVMGLLTKELYLLFEPTKEKKAQQLALVAAFILTTLPWHIHLTRAGFEAGLALFFLLIGFWYLVRYISVRSLSKLIISIAFLTATLYTYHSPKIFVPLILIVFFAQCLTVFWQERKHVAISFFWAALLLTPLVFDSFWGPGAGRLTQTTSYLQNSSFSEKLSLIASQFISHLTPQFLVLGETTNLRQGDGKWGVLLSTQFLILIVGLMIGFIRRGLALLKQPFFLLATAWSLFGILPASLGTDVPHSNRAFLAIPGFIWLSVIACEQISSWLHRISSKLDAVGSHGEQHLILKSFLGTLLLLHCLVFISYTHNYYKVFAFKSSDAYQAGYIQLFQHLKQFEDSTPERLAASQIVISGRYQQPYIFALFSLAVNPYEYHYGRFVKYLFYDKVNPTDLTTRPGAVIVATADDEMPFEQADSYIYDVAGKMRFAIFVNDLTN